MASAGRWPRRAGVSSFGIGGTNAHVVLEEAPRAGAPARARARGSCWCCRRARRRRSSTATDNLVGAPGAHPELDLADVAYTLQVGRQRLRPPRGGRVPRTTLGRDRGVSQVARSRRAVDGRRRPRSARVAFLFPGQGAQYVGMGARALRTEPAFRQQRRRLRRSSCRTSASTSICVSCCTRRTTPGRGARSAAAGRTSPSRRCSSFEYALARLWMRWGVEPQAMLGHSIGEYVAACLAGVFSLDDALALVAARGRLMGSCPAAPCCPYRSRKPKCGRCSPRPLACVCQRPLLVRRRGATDDVARLESNLLRRRIACRRLHTSHAFHSSMMDPILARFTDEVRALDRKPPAIPYISNVSGTWMTAADALDDTYWARQLRQTVRFDDGLRQLIGRPDVILLEVGSGQTLSALVKTHPDRSAEQLVLSSVERSLSSPDRPHDERSDVASLLSTLGRLWLSGARVDWDGFSSHERRRRIPIPGYPFERERYGWSRRVMTPQPPHS